MEKEQPKDPTDDDLKIIPIDDAKTEPAAQKQPEPVEKPVEKPVVRHVVTDTGIEQMEPKKDFVKYVCLKCKYKFNQKVGSSAALRCPYCGSPDVEEDKFNLNKTISEV